MEGEAPLRMEGEALLEGWSECRDGDLGRNAGVWLVRRVSDAQESI
jgi:hypothetical protein